MDGAQLSITVLFHGSGTFSGASLVPSTAKNPNRLGQIGLSNVTVRTAATAEGDSANAPYDVIMLNGATGVAPEGLYRQLREGGRLVGVFAMTQPQRATLVTCSHGDFGNRALFDAAVPVLPGLERVPAFVF